MVFVLCHRFSMIVFPHLGATMMTSIAVMLLGAAAAATPCASLKSISLANTTITLAETFRAGTFDAPPGSIPPPQPGQPAQPTSFKVPAFCRVAATLKPSADSDIALEV